MRSVKSKKDLDKMALASGAVVTDESGRKFNASKKKAAQTNRLKPKEHVEPAPQPDPPAPAPVIQADPEVAKAIEAAGKANVMMLAELKAQMAAIQISEGGRPTEWIFDMIRDDKGYLTRIVASAGRNETIN